MPEPEFDFVQNYVCLTIRFKSPLTPYLTDCGDVNGDVALYGSLKAIYLIVLNNPGIKIGQVAKKKCKFTVEAGM